MRAIAPLLVLALLAPTAAAQFLPRPTWSEGDTWEYPTTGDARLRIRVESLDAVTDGNVTIAAFRVSSAERLPDGSLVGRGEVWYGANDLSRLRETTGGDAPRTLSYDHGCVETIFPLRLGNAWNVTCTGRERGSGAPFTLAYNASVVAVENVTVPVGTFATMVVVRNLSSGPVREHWSSDACHWVRKEGPQGVIELAGFRCNATRTAAMPLPTPAGATPTPASTTPIAPSPTPAPSVALLAAALVALALLSRGGRR